MISDCNIIRYVKNVYKVYTLCNIKKCLKKIRQKSVNKVNKLFCIPYYYYNIVLLYNKLYLHNK
jgi:hypothetical protein